MSQVDASALTIEIQDKDLPVLSVVATQAMKVIDDGEASAGDLEEIIKADTSLTSRVLRLANSPLYGGKVKLASIGQAVVRLGMKNLRNAILMAATGEVFDQSDPYIAGFWEHAIATAITSQKLAQDMGVGNPDEAFVAGMLHDVGKVMIYRQIPEAYATIIDEAAHEKKRFHVHERELIKFCSHETVGALVGRKWGLDPRTVEVIRFHHEVEMDAGALEEASELTSLVSMASLMSNAMGKGSQPAPTVDLESSPPVKAFGFAGEAIESLLESLSSEIDEQQASFV